MVVAHAGRQMQIHVMGIGRAMKQRIENRPFRGVWTSSEGLPGC
jgi:hypothetical protein